MKRIKKYCFFAVFLLGTVWVTEQADAENLVEAGSFSLSPFFQELNLEKDQEQVSFKMEITNNTELPASFGLVAMDFGTLSESSGEAFLGSDNKLAEKYSLAPWISINQNQLLLNPKEKKEVEVSIKNSNSLSPGGHYGAIVAKIKNDDNGSGSESSIVALDQSFASLIFVRKIGGEILGLKLNNLEWKKNFFQLPSMVEASFKNEGNVHVRPRGVVSVFDPFGRLVLKGIINEQSNLILPETSRKYSISLIKIATAFFPGKYKISIDYRYDEKIDFIEQAQYIDFVPVFAILSSLIILGSVAIYGGYRFKKRKQSEKDFSKKD